MSTSYPNIVTTNDTMSQWIAHFIDSLPTEAAQFTAAALYVPLCSPVNERNRYQLGQLITSPIRLTIEQIAGTSGYSKAATWRALPILERDGMLTWRKVDDRTVEISMAPLIELYTAQGGQL